jgi:hypothetical protein
LGAAATGAFVAGAWATATGAAAVAGTVVLVSGVISFFTATTGLAGACAVV